MDQEYHRQDVGFGGKTRAGTERATARGEGAAAAAAAAADVVIAIAASTAAAASVATGDFGGRP